MSNPTVSFSDVNIFYMFFEMYSLNPFVGEVRGWDFGITPFFFVAVMIPFDRREETMLAYYSGKG